MSRVNQPVLALLPARARSVGPSAGLLEGPAGGVVFVFGLATFSYASADQAGRRLAAVQLVTTKIASVAEVASAFGVNEATLWRWKQAFGTGGVVGLVAERPGPRRPSKLTTSLATRIARLDATGLTLQQIAAAAGVSTATVRVCPHSDSMPTGPRRCPATMKVPAATALLGHRNQAPGAFWLGRLVTSSLGHHSRTRGRLMAASHLLTAVPSAEGQGRHQRGGRGGCPFRRQEPRQPPDDAVAGRGAAASRLQPATAHIRPVKRLSPAKNTRTPATSCTQPHWV
jgi:transposase-like protein